MNQHNRLAVKENIFTYKLSSKIYFHHRFNIPFFFQKYFVLFHKSKVRTLKEINYKGKVDKSTD